jgi:glycosyltransferase involved in cell wall biosynthesis
MNGIHDRRFIEVLKQISTVSTHFIRESGAISEIKFDSYDYIVAAPLTESISQIPNNITTPVIGISLGFDVNRSSYSDSLSRNIHTCSLIICDCEYIRNKVCLEYAYPKELTAVIPYGCDLEVFKWDGIRDFQFPRFLVTRNWTKLHSNVLILEAMQILNKANVDFQCIFLGDGAELENARRKVLNSSLESKVEFRGTVSPMEMVRLMQNSNVYISASSSDGSSVSLMEAMANGMVCVASDFPSNLEWITDKQSGFLFRNGSSDNLAEVLSEILEKTPSELRIIGRIGQKIAENRADWIKNKRIFLDSILANSETSK